MFASFICKACKNKLFINLSSSVGIPDNCPKCKANISHPQYLTSFDDYLSGLKRALDNFELCGLTPEKPDHIYKSDMETLHNLYVHSSVEIKAILAKILDTNFLMAYHSAKDDDLEALEEYASSLEALRKERTAIQNERYEKLLRSRED